MSDPFSGLISSDVKSLFTSAIDEVIRGTSVPCRLVYGDMKFTACPNCYQNTITGKSTNRYKANGPYPFSHGTCPFCNGEGKIPDRNEDDTINLAVIWDYRKWFPVAPLVASPEGMVQTLCSIALISRIKRAKEIVVDTNLEKYVRHKFIRQGEPTPIGLGDDQYIVCMWKRSG